MGEYTINCNVTVSRPIIGLNMVRLGEMAKRSKKGRRQNNFVQGFTKLPKGMHDKS